MDFVNFGDEGSEDELEKDYTALKSKENEEQIELRRLRTENRLLRQRIENLEKESASLADKLIQDQVTRAQEAEDTYALKNELSVTRHQLTETQKKLEAAEDIIGDIRRRTNVIQGAVHLDAEEEKNMVQHLQEELIAVRLREAETITFIKELKTKIMELEDTNLRLQRAPSNDVQHLQEELIAVKLREAEANLSLKELRQKVNEIETYWEAHMERMATGASPKEKNSKAEIRHMQEEVMTVKLREAKAVADLKETKQKVMELETQNQICQNQIRRMNEENKEMKQTLEERTEKERKLNAKIKDLSHKLDDTESKRKEEAMMARIKEAEFVQSIAELRHKIAEIDIQKEELLTAGQLQDKTDKDDLENELYDLRDEMIELRMATPHSSAAGDMMMASFLTQHDSDDEWDVEVRDSENLDRTLSDIIEGRSPLTTPSRPIPRFGSLDGAGDVTGEEGSGVREGPEQRADGGAQGTNSHQTPSTADDSVIDDGVASSSMAAGEPGCASGQGAAQQMAGNSNADRDSLGESAPRGDNNGGAGEPGCASGQGTAQQTAGNSNADRDSLGESAPRGDNNRGAGHPMGLSVSAPAPAHEVKVSNDCDENFNEQTVSDSSQSSHAVKSANGDCVSAARGGEADVISSE